MRNKLLIATLALCALGITARMVTMRAEARVAFAGQDADTKTVSNTVAITQDTDAKRPTQKVTVEKNVPVQDIHLVQADVNIGNVRVTVGHGDEIRIKAVRKAEGGSERDRKRWLTETRVEINKQGNTLKIKDIVPKSLDKFHPEGKNFNMELNVTVEMPPRLALTANTDVGGIEVAGETGALQLHCDVGNITLQNILTSGEAVQATTDVGNITVEGAMGSFEAKVNVGKIMAKKLDCRGTDAVLHCDVGDVNAEFLTLPTEKLDVKSETGSADLKLPGSAGIALEAETEMGDIRSDWKLPPRKNDEFELGTRFKTTLNGGGCQVSVRVGIGSIHLKKI